MRARCSGVKPVWSAGSAEDHQPCQTTPRARLVVHRVQLHLICACPRQGGAAGLLLARVKRRPVVQQRSAASISRMHQLLIKAQQPPAFGKVATSSGRVECVRGGHRLFKSGAESALRRAVHFFAATHSGILDASQVPFAQAPCACTPAGKPLPLWARRCVIPDAASAVGMAQHAEIAVVELAGVTVAKPAAAAAGEYTCDEARALAAHVRVAWRCL